MQTIETLFRESFEFNPRKTPWKFEEFSNGNLAVLCRKYDDGLATGQIHFYEKKSEELSLLSTSKVTNCVYLHCFNEKEILFNKMKDVFKIFNIESKKEREISIGDIKNKITYG